MNGEIYLRRKIYDEMLEWKNERGRHKALVIEGLRQIGKSYIVEKFAEKEYDRFYLFDFRKSEQQRDAFKGDFSLDNFRTIIISLFNKPYDDNNALLVFDEIGDCPDARAAIKYILKETNFDIIATGSLLGVKGFSTRTNRSPSVGFEHFITMYPLDFEEFLWANNIDDGLIKEINNSLLNYDKMNEYMHNKLTELHKSYQVVGGMPESVLVYLETHDYYKCYEKNLDKLKEMEGDFGRVLNKDGNVIIDSNLLIKIREVYNSLASQLAKKNSKFQFSLVKKGSRAKEYEEAINWLLDSGLVKKCCNLSDIGSPLSMYALNDIYKLYFTDMGLFFAKVGFSAISAFLRDDSSSVMGYIYENIAADTLIKQGYDLYYSNNGVTELDFLIETKEGPAIIEVKKGNQQSKSARAVIEGRANRHANVCYKIRNANFGRGAYFNGVPHYGFIFLLKKIRKELIDSLK